MLIKSLTTLIFDLDGTLCTYDTELEESLFRTFDVEDIEDLPITPTDYEEGFGLVFDRAIDGNLNWQGSGFRTRIFLELLQDDEDFAKTGIVKLGEKFTTIRENALTLFPEVSSVFERLRDRFKLGLLTNGPSSLQRAKIEKLGIESWFDSIIVSGDHELVKPDPRIFEIALEKLGSTRENTIYVGNSLKYDVLGANNAELPVVWREDGEEEETEGAVPDLVINDLTELIDGEVITSLSDKEKRSIKT